MSEQGRNVECQAEIPEQIGALKPEFINVVDMFFCLAYCLSLTAMICVPLVVLAKLPAALIASIGAFAVCVVFPCLVVRQRK